MVLTVLLATLVVITPNYHGSIGSCIVLYTVDDVEVRICTGEPFSNEAVDNPFYRLGHKYSLEIM